jgi:hypothetical protein
MEQSLQNLDLDNPVTLGNSLITTQISKTDDQSMEEQNKQAIDNRLSTLNITECTNKLKDYYHLPKNTSLILIKYDLDKSLSANLSQAIGNSVSFDLYNPSTMKKLNVSLCDSYEVQTPIADMRDLNKTLYQQFKNQSVDIFNPKDEAFTSRCSVVIDPDTGYSTTLNYRIKKYYQNKTINCGNGCSYKSMNDNDYVTCQCSGVTSTDSEIINNIGDFFINGFTNINVSVFICYKQVFNVYKY